MPDLPHTTCLRGAAQREVRNWRKPIHAADCPERLTFDFVRWIWNYRRDSRPRLDAALARYAAHLSVVELTFRKDAVAFLARPAPFEQ